MTGTTSDIALHHEVQQFLFMEARLLDDGLFDEWLELFTDDCRYWMPARETTMALADSVRDDRELPIFDDDKSFLRARVSRLTKTPMAHAEQPRSRTRHFVTNVWIAKCNGDELTVEVNLLVYQSRLERTESTFVGRRTDVVRRTAAGLRIAYRKIILDQTLIPRSLSIFF